MSKSLKNRWKILTYTTRFIYWEYVKNREIADIYFDTTEDLGEAGVDDVYGHGLIDIKAAFEEAEIKYASRIGA